jgi:predicted dehydrogenase
MAVGQSDVRLVEDRSSLTVTAPDQVAVHGTLANGAVLSAFYRGGLSRAENFRWAITGTDGELVLTSDTPANGNIQAIDLQLAGAFGGETHIAGIQPPDRDRPAVAAVSAGPARNVARLYSALADDLRDGITTVPDFAYALRQHRLVNAIQTAAGTGRTQPAASG